jgi:hypothetical protein
MAIKIAKKVMQLLAGRERLNTQHNSSELLTCGLHVVAVAR